MPILDHLIKPQQDSGHSEAPLANAFQNAPVLLVEDEPDMAAEVTKELTNLGYHVRVAETEAEGLAAARSHPAALMIVDRMLKGIDKPVDDRDLAKGRDTNSGSGRERAAFRR
jgi:ActR/RegA family two-component response regulator